MENENKTTFLSPLVRLVLLVALGHFVIDFMLSIWPVYKTMARLDLAKAGLIAAGSIIAGELMQLYFGKLIDRGYQRMLLIMSPLLASAAIFFPYFGSYSLFFLLILLTCIGSAAFHPTAASLLGALDTPRKATLFGFFQTAGNFGMGVGQFLFAQTYDILYGHTAVLILPVLALSFMIWISNASISKPTDAKASEKISMSIIVSFFRSKPLRSLYFAQVANQTILWSTVFLLPDFLVARGAPHWVCFGGGHFTLLLGATVGCIPMSMLGAKITPAKTILGSFVVTI
jgi:MFS transporter, FSR family, fosmidomycin resistance protein